MQTLWPRYRPAAPALAGGLLLLALLFHTEAAAALHVWNTSTAYGHCWLVFPLVLWLLWERRAEAAAVPIAPNAPLALLILPLAAFWLMADLLGVMEGRQLAAIGCVEVLLLTVLGPRLWWALSAAFLYMIFLVPFGAFLTPALQNFTAAFVAHGLDFLNIPSNVTAYRIEIPEGQFYVAEACAGLRFLIASIAFGTLYAVTMFQSPLRRALFILASLIIPVVANGFRALGIVVLGHVLGSAQAAVTDHILYGWIFFSIVILLLAVSGMPFRQDAPPMPPPGPLPAPALRTRALAAGAGALVLAAAGPLLSIALGTNAAAPSAATVLITPPACILTTTRPAGAILTSSYLCGDAHVLARLEILPHGANPSRITEAGGGQSVIMLGGGDLDGSRLQVSGTNPATWAEQRDRENPRAAASTLFIDGAPALGGLHDRLRMTRDLLTGTGRPAAALVVAVIDGKEDPEKTLQGFLSAQGDLNSRVGKLVN